MNESILRNDVDETAGEGDLNACQQLEDIAVPVTVAWGELDVPFLALQGELLVKRLPHTC